MHTLLLLLCGLLLVSGVMLLICNFNDDGMTPVRKMFECLFIAVCAVVVTAQVAMDHPALTRNQVAVMGHALSAEAIEPSRSVVVEPDPAAVVPAAVADRDLVERQAGVPVQRVVTTAPVQVVAPAQADSGAKDMMLGGALGYLMGSAGNRGGGDTHTVTHNTTIVHAAPAPVSPAPRPGYVSPPPARPAYTAPAVSRPTFRSTFTNRVRR